MSIGLGSGSLEICSRWSVSDAIAALAGLLSDLRPQRSPRRSTNSVSMSTRCPLD